MSLSHEQILALLEAAGLTRPAAEEAAARVAVELERGERGAAGERGERDERGERGAAGERGERDERGERGEHAEHDEHDDTGEYGDTGEEARLGSPPGTEETLQQHGFPSGPGAGGAGDGTGAGDGDGASAGDWPGPGARKPGDGKGRKIGLLRPGERVDQYEVIRSLGAGGMGEVFLARDALLGRLAALKVVHPHLLSAAGSVERFLFEARATARFSHPSIVTIYGLGQVRGSPYIALEYLQGSTLRDRLKGGPLPLGETVETARRVAAALEEAHRQGVLHCDLKPENVFLPRDGRLRVLDFGLARLVEEKRLPVAPGSEQASEDGAGTKAAAPISVTATGSGSASGTAPGSTPVSVSASSLPPDLSPRPETTLRGTTSYMAPEQWQKMPLGPATDLWAFGVVLFEMLAGRRPFLGSPVAIYERVSAPDAAKRAAKALPPHLPAELRSLCLQCLARDPRERPTAQEAAARLRALSPERAGRARDAEESPFRGLLPFRRDHADLFFGRDPEIAAFVERLRGSPLLAVLGPSGAGKSSFVQAGVIPRLHSLGAWDCLVVRPGTAPLHTLAARLERGQDEQSESAPASPARDSPEDGDGSPEGGGSARLPSETTLEARRDLAARLGEEPGLLGKLLRERAAQAGGRVLLVVDQLEEVFTLTRDPAERESLCRALLFAADDPEGPVRLVLTIREDFLGRLALFPDLIAEVSRGIFVMRTLGPEALAETLREPVLRRGYRFEDDSLVTDMTAEVASEPSGLPLLQFAATRLWEGRDRERRLLLRSTYEAIGGVEGALAAHADHALQGLVGAASGAAKELLLRLVTPEGTRAARKEEDLVAEAGPGGREALDHLVAARLLVSRRGVSGAKPVTELELVHESLLHRWDRLRRWLEESREDVRLRAELEGAVGQWRRRGGRDDDLWRGRSLAEALDWRERQSAPLHPATDDFLRASEALARRSAVRRTQVKAVAAALALLLAVGVGALLRVRQGELRARQAWAAAEKARRDARSRLAAALLEGAQT
ncbi:MAG: protein kinase, partial [Polyangia bacterium]|nr:protein kinase [Polyangia bacterium]